MCIRDSRRRGEAVNVPILVEEGENEDRSGMLLDTAASISLMSYRALWEGLCKGCIDVADVALLPKPISVRVGNGQSFDIVGKCAVKFRFTTGPTLKVTFYCAEVLSYPYVLGLPTQQRAGAVFDFHTGTVTFKELDFSMSLDHGGGPVSYTHLTLPTICSV